MPPHVVVQMGHVGRTTGSTGTHREQEFTSALGPLVARKLTNRGFRVTLIDAVTGANDSVPTHADAFIALHGDGSSDPARRGASVGFPDDTHSAELAWAWKNAHSRSYPGPWHRDNYTPALRGYYMWRRTSHIKYRFLAEHGTLTNRADERWLFSNLSSCATAHAIAVTQVLASPVSVPEPKDPFMADIVLDLDDCKDIAANQYKAANRTVDTNAVDRYWGPIIALADDPKSATNALRHELGLNPLP